MRIRALPWIVLLGLLPCVTGARAEDQASPERRAWVLVCMRHIGSEDALVQRGAMTALVSMGLEVIPETYAGLHHLTCDAHWSAYQRVLVAMGSKAAAQALDDTTASWPAAHADRLTELLIGLLAAIDSPPPDLPEAVELPARDGSTLPEDVDREARKILATFHGESHFSSGDPRLRTIIRLGRGAVPALVEALRDDDGPHRFTGYASSAAAEALAGVVTKEDVPLMIQLLEDGHLKVSKALGRFDRPEVRAAFVRAVEGGALDHELLAALTRFQDDEAVRGAVKTWLRQWRHTERYIVGGAAQFLALARDPEDLPLLLEVLRGDLNAGARVDVADVVARLGAREGISVLVDEMEKGPGSSISDRSVWVVARAGEALNRLTGQSFFVPRYRDGPVEGNFAEAAQRYRAWWTENEARLRFDETRRRWIVAEK